jgi:hypothetical protein
LNYATNISFIHKYVYIETPKVACSSIKLILQRIELKDFNLNKDMDILHNREYSPLLKPTQVGDFGEIIKKKEFFKFCFVRNPYTRILSAYLDKIASKNEDTFRKHCIYTQLGYDFRSTEQTISFKDFVRSISTHPIKMMDPHWRPQYYQTLQDFVDYDFIGRFESIERDIEFVVKKIAGRKGKKYITQSRTHKTGADSLIRQYYTEEIRDMVYTKYRKDFNYFGYSSVLNELSPTPANSIGKSCVISEQEMSKILEKTRNLENSKNN